MGGQVWSASSLSPKAQPHAQPNAQLEVFTRCSWQDTKVWKPGDTPKPSWWIYGGSSWLWICTRIPASNDVSSAQWRRGPLQSHPRQVAQARVPRLALSHSRLRTCLSPDRQVLLLLDVQHYLQATAHAPRPAGKGALRVCIESVTLPIASIDLWGEREEKGRWKERPRQLLRLRVPCPPSLRGLPDCLGSPVPCSSNQSIAQPLT